MSKGQKQTTETSAPAWQTSQFQDLLGQSNAATQQGISLANAPGVVNQIQGSTQGILGQQLNGQQLASGITGAGSSAWTDPGTASSYMNPYVNNALSSQINVDRTMLLNPALAGADSSAAASGALGGDRSQVLKGQIINGFNQNESNQVAQGLNSAYNTGLSAYQADSARNLAGQEAGAQTQLSAAGSNIYANSAATQNGLAGIAAAESPEQQYATQAGILATAPHNSTTTQTQTPNGGALGGILGGIIGGAAKLIPGMKEGGIVDSGIMAGTKKKKTRRAPKKKKVAR